ncbi:unnamed protein product [Adineta steineri]|uniref:Uncharacterized protein n=1 Tax=Adineta steineri TaxID=433720 RepID=A0A815HP75_9BILA|nr:unnamed protein product [Adineta steineri]CAF1355191.1 unnamed protein product [Adineta steineri]CAF1432711.1 unnamed protein product [Adineta steineri]
MLKYIALYCFIITLLNQIKTNYALPTELQEETYRVQNNSHISKQLRTTKLCTTNNDLRLYIPYSAVKFFWSGFGVADSDKVAAEIARSVAEKDGKKGVTLEMLLDFRENTHIQGCKSNISMTPQCQQFWENLSCEYATRVTGEIRIILGSKLNPEDRWFKIEKPTLDSRRSNGQDLWGFKQYELEPVYCKDMATHDTSIPQIKNEICQKNS